MKKLNIKKIMFKVQYSTKKEKNRYIPMNDNALRLMKLHFDKSDCVRRTRYGVLGEDQ